MIHLDGSHGEGGGQILRTALAFSIITQQPFTITNIRAGRQKPGLKMQHVNCITALQQLSESKASTIKIGATELTFTPAPLHPKNITIDIKTAGSITLLLQSLLLPIIETATTPVTLHIIGGTDVQWSPPADYYTDVFLPAIKAIADIEFTVKKRGYYPKGGGIVEVKISPKKPNVPKFNIKCNDEYLGDQLLPFLTVAGGKIIVPVMTEHIRSNVYAIEAFVKKKFVIGEKSVKFDGFLGCD